MIRKAGDARTQAVEREKPSESPSESLIDTSKMSKGQAAALEVAESARDQGNAADGFAGNLLLGRLRMEMLDPFPRQSDEDRAIGDEMVAKVTAYLRANLDPEEVDETRTIPKRVVKGLKALGVFRMKVPAEYGGLEFSQVNYNRVMMAIASHCGSTAVLISAHQSIGVPQPLKMFGTEEQKRRYLPRIAEGELSAFALTEPNVGSDPARMETTATLSADGRYYELSGVKQWATNGPIADLLVVMARTGESSRNGSTRPRITAFLVESAWTGVEVVHRCDFMGLRGIQNGIIRFRDVRVPVENVLWGEGLGLKLALRTLNTGRLTLPAACAGLAKQCLSIARRWGAEREQWGRSIGSHEAGAEKIADIASSALAMEAVTWLTSHWADEGRDIRIEAAMAKLFCSEAAWRVIDETMQLRGGRGYERATSLRERGEAAYPVERMMRDARINTIIEGTSDIMRLFLAREALDPHLQIAADLLRPGLPAGRRARAAGRVLRHYAAWYPACAAGIVWGRGRSMGRLAGRVRFIDRASARLALALFHAMAANGPKLERRQVLLGHLMDIGTDLFAMAATCSYAASLGEPSAVELADLFCRRTKVRVRETFGRLRRGDERATRGIAKGVLAGKLRWMEEGIIRCGPDE